MRLQMHWDYIIILFIITFVVPWRSRSRVQMLLRSGALGSSERMGVYISTIAFQWLVSIIIFWRSFARGINLITLGFALPEEFRAIVVTLTLSLILALNQIFGVKRLAILPFEKRGIIAQIAQRLLPRTRVEKLTALFLIFTVALCEEFIYRGFVQAAFQQVLNSALAASLISAVLFAAAHVYQGRRGVVTTFVIGLLFSAVRVGTGSLWPSIIIHFIVDFCGGIASARLIHTNGNEAPEAIA